MSADVLVAELDSQRRKVDFDTYDILVQQLVSMVEQGSIDVAPVYQRQFRWDTARRSQLVESVFLGVPVPSLFMAANKDGTWELVDGVQRLSTLVQYVGSNEARDKLGLPGPLEIVGLKKLEHLNGLMFGALPQSLQLQFKNRPIKVITLSDKSDMVVRFDLFERLNTGGIALTNQEIRSCIFRGQFNSLLERLSARPNFHKVLRLVDSQETDGTREECVLRFFAFLNNYKAFQHSVVDFLNEYMREASQSFDFQEGERIFEKTFSQLARLFPHGIRRRKNTTPVNLFEGIAVGAALALQQNGKLVSKGMDKWLQSEKLRRCTTGGTNNQKMVSGRIEFCRDRFLGL